MDDDKASNECTQTTTELDKGIMSLIPLVSNDPDKLLGKAVKYSACLYCCNESISQALHWGMRCFLS